MPTRYGWLDIMRAVAMFGIVFHNWLMAIPSETGNPLLQSGTNLIASFSGSLVQVFFVLSGYGLALAYFQAKSVSWDVWARRRFVKVIVPYWVAISLTLILALISNDLAAETGPGYSITTLLVYLAFLQNFVPAFFDFNRSMWFMPVLVGLYGSFPVLIRILKRYGPWVLLVISLLVTYASITVFMLAGYPMGNLTGIFLFYIAEFCLGIVFACLQSDRAKRIALLDTPMSLWLGGLLYVLSFAVRVIWVNGSAFNDFLTAAGLYLVLQFAARVLAQSKLQQMVRILEGSGRVEFLVYLIHFPLIVYIVKPLFGPVLAQVNPIVCILLGSLYGVLMFGLAMLGFPVVAKLTALSDALITHLAAQRA